jgi:Fic family protein
VGLVQVEEFRDSPVGELRTISGHDALTQRDYRHFAFVPRTLPESIPLTERTYCVVSEAHMAIGRLDFAVKRLPDPALLVRPTVRREAVSTSALEGTYAPLQSVFEADYVDEVNQSAEVREVRNYVRAAERALELIKTRPICLNVIAELQKILVKDTRGDTYDAGQLRQRQVFIGERSAGIERSRFVPPPPGDELVDGVTAWEKWINGEDNIPLLVKMAIGHYQFEALHPFSDGNGRLGRLIAILQLIEANALTFPVLNLSPWLEARKEEYKDLLLNISRTGEFDAWAQFFCECVSGQADDTVKRIEELLAFGAEVHGKLRKAKVRGVANEIADDLLGYPIITASEAARRHGVTYPPASNAMNKLVEIGILREITGRSYGRIFACDRVMWILGRP